MKCRASIAVRPEMPKNMIAAARAGSEITLRLLQVAPDMGKEQLVFRVTSADRYEFEVHRNRSGDGLEHYDTVHCRRHSADGASGFEHHRCLITDLPATDVVSFGSYQYYVGGPGCKAAFEHNPEQWIGRARALSAARLHNGPPTNRFSRPE